MKGSEVKLLRHMEGTSKRFIIPVYQRNYDWKQEHCKQLFDDLVSISENGRPSHFFGSIVSAHQASGNEDRSLIIDGQQRLTTVSILLLAMRNLVAEGRIESKNKHLPEEILEKYLIDKWANEERIKLKPVKNDKEAFEKLYGNKSDYLQGSNVTINYRFFEDKILEQKISIDGLYEAVQRLEIIHIELEHDDDPQLIFESLNSTGLDLSEGDKIRNLILMGLSDELQEKYYEQYWNPIEIATSYHVDAFMRDYLSVKKFSVSNIAKVYTNFKSFKRDDWEGDLETLLVDILEFAKRYKLLLGSDTGSKRLNGCIMRLNRLETTVARPFFLHVLKMHDQNKLNMADIEEIFSVTESYVFRRSICELPTNSLNKIFASLHREICNLDGTDEDYVNKFKYALLSKQGNQRFPDDDEFYVSFSDRQIYKTNSKTKVYVLERLENFDTKEDKDIYAHVDDGEYSIEHIMPQKLSHDWRRSLGKESKTIHEMWLDRIANLTLTAYNSKYSNLTFEEKKTMKNGFMDSGIRLNQEIAKFDCWTEDELKKRDEILTERAQKIWSYPKSTYVPSRSRDSEVMLDDDEFDFQGEGITGFKFEDKDYEVNNWKDMFTRVLKCLYNHDNSILVRICSRAEHEHANIFKNSKECCPRNPELIGEGVWVETNNNTVQKIHALRYVFDLYDIDQQELSFKLKSSEE